MPHLRHGQRQRGDEDGHGRCRNAAEGRLLRLVDVETGQTDGGKHGQQEGHTRQQVDAVQSETRQVEGVVHHIAHDQARSNAERHHIRERVQVGTDGRMGIEEPRRKAVKEVEKPCHKDHKGRLDRHSRGDKQDGKTTRQQIAAGDDVRDVLLEIHGRVF